MSSSSEKKNSYEHYIMWIFWFQYPLMMSLTYLILNIHKYFLMFSYSSKVQDRNVFCVESLHYEVILCLICLPMFPRFKRRMCFSMKMTILLLSGIIMTVLASASLALVPNSTKIWDGCINKQSCFWTYSQCNVYLWSQHINKEKGNRHRSQCYTA